MKNVFLEKAKGNKLITRVFLLFYGAMFGDSFLHIASGLVDTAMAGAIFELNALAGVGICGLFLNLWFMLSSLFYLRFFHQNDQCARTRRR